MDADDHDDDDDCVGLRKMLIGMISLYCNLSVTDNDEDYPNDDYFSNADPFLGDHPVL